MTRKIIQIAVTPEGEHCLLTIVALCDDGSTWSMSASHTLKTGWTEWEGLADIPQDEPAVAAKAEPAASLNPIRGAVYGTKVILTNEPGCLNLIISAEEAMIMGRNILDAGMSAQRKKMRDGLCGCGIKKEECCCMAT